MREVSGSIEWAVQADLDEVAAALGVDLARARELAESAVEWLRAQAEGLGDDGTSWSGARRGGPVGQDPSSRPGPHPLGLPTAEQGRALAAVDSGRWKVEPRQRRALKLTTKRPGQVRPPGSSMSCALRNWITANCQLTLAGRHALSRWLDTADSIQGDRVFAIEVRCGAPEAGSTLRCSSARFTVRASERFIWIGACQGVASISSGWSGWLRGHGGVGGSRGGTS